MSEYELSVLRDVRQLVDSLPDDFSVYDPLRDRPIPMPESLVRAREADLLPFAEMAFPVYLFMLRESQAKTWSIDEIYREFDEKNPDSSRDETFLRNAITLLVTELCTEQLLEFVGEVPSLFSERAEFFLKREYESQAKACEYCAKLAELAGESKEIVEGYLHDANVFRKESEY